MTISRRRFLAHAGAGLTMAGLVSGPQPFGLMSALAQSPSGDEPQDYRALVCIYFNGGNDGNNTIVPLHSDQSVSGYDHYFQARGPRGLALSQKSLLPIAVPRIGGSAYGLHPAFGTVANGINPGLHPLWGTGTMAVVSGVGPLMMPITRAQFQADPSVRPRNLFSHTDQTQQHHHSRADAVMLSGWGGRIADKMTIGSNPNRLVPTVSSVVGPRLFAVGENEQPLSIGPAPTPLSSIFSLTGYNGTPIANARLAALEAQLLVENGQDMVEASNSIQSEALRISRTLNSANEVSVVFPATDLGNQLKQIARMIKARSSLRVNRQVFYCSLDGFDTHNGQLLGQQGLLTHFSQASRAFYDEMAAQGIADKVTQFTLTDFNRTFDPAGTGANVGSDHGWANHQFVIGGAVTASDFYGINSSNGTPFPTLVNNGPDDADFGTGARGRWIPTASVEQYAGTLARWFGLSQADMPFVFPNIGNFPVTDLGFMTNA